jgi:tetratricopeptide (TPR) repeat protein
LDIILPHFSASVEMWVIDRSILTEHGGSAGNAYKYSIPDPECQEKEMDLSRGYLGESPRVTMHGHATEICKCLHSLWCLYRWPGTHQEGAAVFERAVDALRVKPGEEPDEERDAALGLALRLQAYFSRWVGRADSEHTLIEEGLSILSRLGARCQVALAYALGDPTLDAASHRRLLEKSLALSKQLAYYPAMARALEMLSFDALQQGLYLQAERYAQEALDVCSRLGALTDAAFAHAALGHLAFARGDYAAYRRCYEESLTLFQHIGQSWAVGRLHAHLGDVAMAVGGYEQAKEHYQRALDRYQEAVIHWSEERKVVGGSWGIPVSLQRLGDVALAQGDLAEAGYGYRLALDAASGRSEEALKPHVLLGPAALLARIGEVERAV